MKKLQILMAAMLLMVTGSALADVSIVHPDEGDSVSAKSFNITAKAEGLCALGDSTTIEVNVRNNSTGITKKSFVFDTGAVHQVGIEMIMPKPSPCSSHNEFQIVARVTGETEDDFITPGEPLTIEVQVRNNSTGETFNAIAGVAVR